MFCIKNKKMVHVSFIWHLYICLCVSDYMYLKSYRGVTIVWKIQIICMETLDGGLKLATFILCM